MATKAGTEGANTITGTSTADLLDGRGGDDLVYGYAGRLRARHPSGEAPATTKSTARTGTTNSTANWGGIPSTAAPATIAALARQHRGRAGMALPTIGKPLGHTRTQTTAPCRRLQPKREAPRVLHGSSLSTDARFISEHRQGNSSPKAKVRSSPAWRKHFGASLAISRIHQHSGQTLLG